MHLSLDEEHLAQFAREGYCVVRGALAGDTLEMLRRESDAAVRHQVEAIERGDRDVEMLNRLRHRYFVPRRALTTPVLDAFLTGEAMASFVRPIVGDDAFLFLEVFIHKEPHSQSDFKWHQDHGYVAYFGFGHFPPNLSVWMALDDVDADNGALVVRSFVDDGRREPIPHEFDAATNDCHVPLPSPDGRTVEMAAGDVLLLSGLVLHRSGPNTTARPRRAYLAQYSSVPLLVDGRPVMRATRVLDRGRWVGGSGA